MADGSLPRSRRLERGIAWTLRNIDGVLAIGVALAVGLTDIFDTELKDNIVSGATLLVLAALVLSLLTERKRRISDIRGAMAETYQALQDLTMVRSLSGDKLEQALAEARRDTDRWVFKGGTGGYLRAVTLPECIRSARQRRRGFTMRIEIINPDDERVCVDYARFRQTFANRQAGVPTLEWTTQRARKESYATVLAACWYRQRLDTLDIDVSLSSIVPTLRFDMSASSLFITQDDQLRVNFLVESDQPLYDYYATELHQSREQSTPLDLRGTVPLSEEPTVDEVGRLFEGLGIPLPLSFTDTDIGEIAEKALHAENPYGR